MACFRTKLEKGNHLLQKSKIAQATTVDDIIKYHDDFLDTSLKACMLTDQNLVKIHTKVMATAAVFASISISAMKSLALQLEAPNENVAKFIKSEKQLNDTVGKVVTGFQSCLKQLIDALEKISSTEANQQMANLAMRLDFNDFYKKQDFGDVQKKLAKTTTL